MERSARQALTATSFDCIACLSAILFGHRCPPAAIAGLLLRRLHGTPLRETSPAGDWLPLWF